MNAANKRPFHMMVKPIGPICNLDCEYCFYLHKEEKLFTEVKNFRMTDEVAEEYVKQFIRSQPGPHVEFSFQGGEPTLMGLDFFKKIIEYEKKYLPEGWTFSNTFQTNGTLLTAEWCDFLRDNNFLIGISIDGPAELHDFYRHTKGGRATHEKVMKGLKLLKDRNVEYNILCSVNNVNGEQPLEVYRFYREIGAEFIQFIPIVEHLGEGKVTHRSVPPKTYGSFLMTILDEWIRNDIGKMYVQIIEECFRVWLGYPAGLCLFREMCGDAMILEHNGDVYSCDHFVFEEYRLGSILERPIEDFISLPFQVKFGRDKSDALPKFCLECDVKFICNGGCPKNRIIKTPDGEPGLNYLCEGYKMFFHYVGPYMEKLASYFRKEQPPALYMNVIRQEDKIKYGDVKRNDPCPCGSGKKFKKCHYLLFPEVEA